MASHIALTAAACSALVALGPVSMGAGADWTPVTSLTSTGQNALTPQVAVAADWTTTAVWSRSNGTNTLIQSATRASGASTFGLAANLSSPGQNAGAPQIAVNAAGLAAAVWVRSDGTDPIVQVATRPAGAASFGAASSLSAAGQTAFAPQVAVAPSGAITVAWYRYDGAHMRIQAATRPEGFAGFDPPETLSAAGANAYDPQLAVSSDGTVTAVWTGSDGAHNIVRSATRPPGTGSFGTVSDLSAAGEDNYAPQVAAAPDGTVTAVWNGATVQSATRPAGESAFGPVSDLPAAGGSPGGPQVAAAADGSVTAVWTRSDGANRIVQTATRPRGAGAFGAVTDLSAPGRDASEPQVAVAGDGAVTVAWLRSNGTENIAQAATRPAGAASFGAVRDLSADGRAAVGVQVAASTGGLASAAWYRSDGTNTLVQTTATGLEVPSALTAPSITGTLATGRVLTCVPGTWSGALTTTTSWLLDGVAITGADAATHTVGADEAGHDLACRERAVNPMGATSSTSAPATVPAPAVAPAPVLTPSAPRILGLSFEPAAFRPGLTGRTAGGSVLRFRLSDAAALRLTIEPVGPRTKSVRTCPSGPTARRGGGCVVRGVVTLTGRAGVNRTRFSGRIGSRRLAPGAYRLTAEASALGVRSDPERLTFRVLP